MKPSAFAYHAPDSVAEAVAILAEHGHHAKILAGGQSLVPILNMRLAAPEHLVDINGLPDLDRVAVDADAVQVGALVRHADLAAHEDASIALPLLRHALRHVAHPAIRNRGTTVGSLAHADPAGEMPAVLALTGGSVEAVRAGGRRRIESHEFFQGPLESCLGEDEMLVSARFDRFPAGTGTAFAEIARRHGDYALAGVAAAVTSRDGVVSSVRLSFVSVTPVPGVLDLAELYAGTPLDEADWTRAGPAVNDFVDPDSDIHATAEYRRALSVELAARTLAEAAGRVEAVRAA